MSSREGGRLPRVKICGITRYEDARLALDLGAWALGFIFHRASPRYLEPAAARALLARLPRETLAVAVVVDRPVEETQRLIDEVGARGVQLHGGEPPEEVEALRAEVKIKAFRVGAAFDPAAVEAYRGCHILLDTYRSGAAGGTGETFDWSVAQALSRARAVILAGGIGPENARQALEKVRPFALDVSSRVEAAPGEKDADKLKELFEALAGTS